MMPKKLNLPLWITWSTLSIALLPVVPNLINSICMIIWAGLVLMWYFLQGRSSAHRMNNGDPVKNNRLFFLFGGNFLLLTISLFYSIAPAKGIDFLVVELPMLLFPVCFFLTGLPLQNKASVSRTALTIFWASTCLMTLWIFYHYWQQGLLTRFNEASSFNTIFRQTAEQCTDKHPDYISIFLVFSTFIAVDRIFAAGTPLKKILYGLSIPLMVFLLVVLAERSPILALITGMVILCFLRIRKAMTRWIVALSVVSCFLLVIRYTPAIWSRIMETKNTPFQTPVGLHFNSTNVRIGIYKCSWELISRHPFLGVGAGSDRPLLEACYTQFPTDAYRLSYYNTHNQYVNFWLLGGIFSLLLFVGSLVYSSLLSLRSKDHILLFFLVTMAISFLSENVLSRQAGVVFYYYFICLIIYCRDLNKRRIATQQRPANTAIIVKI